MEKTTFQILNDINLKDKIEQKMGLSYLSWANAWSILKSLYPDSSYTIYTRTIPYEEQIVETYEDEITKIKTTKTTTKRGENEVPYFTDGKTTYVKVGVTVNGNEEIEIYPIMDLKNNAVPVTTVTMTTVNKALQRAFVKACARHGLGLYIYAGEDVPEIDKPKLIALDVIVDRCNKLTLADGDDVSFKKWKEKVVEVFTKSPYAEYITKGVTDFAASVLNGKRIGQLDVGSQEDILVIKQIYNYIASVDEELAK